MRSGDRNVSQRAIINKNAKPAERNKVAGAFAVCYYWGGGGTCCTTVCLKGEEEVSLVV